MAEDKIKYEDLVEPDDSFKNLLKEIVGVNKALNETLVTIKETATGIKAALDKVSGATDEGRKSVDDATIAANRLAKAQKELAFAKSETGKQVAVLKGQIQDENKQSVTNKKALDALAGSYNKLKLDLADLTKLYKSLSEAERNDANMGGALLATIVQRAAELKKLDQAMKPHVKTVTELEKAEARLKYLQESEGQKLLEVRKQIRELSKAKKEQATVNDELARAQHRLAEAQKAEYQTLQNVNAKLKEIKQNKELLAAANAYDATSLRGAQARLDVYKSGYANLSDTDREGFTGASYLNQIQRYAELTEAIKSNISAREALARAQAELNRANSAENAQLQELNVKKHEAIRIAKLQAQVNTSEKGSYNNLAAQYELNKIKLNAMSAEQRSAAGSGKALEEETKKIYEEMIRLQEATGNYRLSVGHYQRTWDGLGMSVAAVVRELPAATVSANTFFLAISNNIPMLADEIIKLRKQNKLLAAEGKETISVGKSLIKAFLNWNTVLVIGLTILSQYGKDILEWGRKLVFGIRQAESLEKALRNVNKQLDDNTGEYGKNLVEYKRLQNEWKKLDSLKEQTKWIEKNDDAFKSLNVNIRNVKDADDLFVKSTERVIKAFQYRAKAAAAEELAQQKYREAFSKEEESQNIAARGTSWTTTLKAWASTYFLPTPADQKGLSGDVRYLQNIRKARKNEADDLKKESKVLEQEADRYFAIAAEFNELADSLSEYEKKKKGKGRTPTDLTERINKKTVEIAKKHRDSLRQLEEEDSAQKLQKIKDDAKHEQEALTLQYNKNKQFMAASEKAQGKSFEVAGKLYVKLTKKQIEQLKDQNAAIKEVIENNAKFVAEETTRIALEEQKAILDVEKQTIELKLEAIKKGSEEEMRLRQQLIRNEYSQALVSDRLKAPSKRTGDATITAKYAKASTLGLGESELSLFEDLQKLASERFNVVRRSDQEITVFSLTQERDLWAQKLMLAEQGSLDWSDVQVETAKATIERLNREISEADSLINLVGEKGLGGALLTKLGFDDASIAALDEATQIIIDNIKAIAQAEVDAAQIAVEAQEERVEAAQKAYEAELEARANGYANNVATTKKELLQEKKKQMEKQKMLEAAKRKQESLDSVAQASSLITASANIWSSLSKVPIVGPALAIAAIAGMWTSFAAAKIKAKQVTAVQEYGAGGLEFLEGGSHASGNDIDLHTRNRRGKHMRAEGGEALAIINKRRTRQYKSVLPSIIDSLNKGTFEQNFTQAFASADRLAQPVQLQSNVDLTNLEKNIEAIRKNGEERVIAMPDGSTMIIHKNVRRIIKH